MRGARPHEYTPLPLDEKEPSQPARKHTHRPSTCSSLGFVLCLVGGLFAVYGLAWYTSS